MPPDRTNQWTAPISARPHPAYTRMYAAALVLLVIMSLAVNPLPAQQAGGGVGASRGPAAMGNHPATLPEHSPLNPTVAERTGVYVQPYLPPADGWSWSATAEYGSIVERNINFPDSYLLDAELVRLRFQLRRDLGTHAFLLAEAGVAGAFSGVSDGFFESYHRLIRFTMEERDARPHNRFGDRLLLQSRGMDRRRDAHPMLPTDARLAAGLRLGPSQTVLSMTIPTAPTRSLYHRGTVSLALLETLRLPTGERLYADLSGGVGYTPSQGMLEPIQNTTFILGSASARLRLWGNHAVFATFYGQSAPYRDTNFPELDLADTGIDFGYLWQSRGGRQWRVGLTEDLRRRDPGMDLALKVSTSR